MSRATLQGDLPQEGGEDGGWYLKAN